MPTDNNATTQNFVTAMNGYNIYQTPENRYRAVKRETTISQKIVDSFTTDTLLDAVSRTMNGQKMAANQLARVREAVLKFAQNELAGYFVFARTSHKPQPPESPLPNAPGRPDSAKHLPVPKPAFLAAKCAFFRVHKIYVT